MNSHTLTAQTVEAFKDVFLSFLSVSASKPTLGIVFSSPNQDIQALTALFSEADIALFGCTTAGEIADDRLLSNHIVCLLLDPNPAHFRLILVENTEGVLEVGKKIRRAADDYFKNPALLVASAGVLNDGEEIVAGLKTAIEIPIFGGLAADNLEIVETIVFTNKTVCNNGILALVFDGDFISLQGLATSGWEPLGIEHTVTKAEGNKIFTINNEPALDFFLRFFGKYDAITAENFTTTSAQYPFQVIKEGVDYSVLRSPILGDEAERSLHLVGSIKEGDRFRFSISPGVEVVEKTVEEFGQFNSEKPNADALILFSCKGRHAALGPFLRDEVAGISDLWQKPMIGFLSYGEIGNLSNGICEFHNETCSLVLIKEK